MTQQPQWSLLKAVTSTPQPRRKSVRIVRRVASVVHADVIGVIGVSVKAALIATVRLHLVRPAKAVVIAVKLIRPLLRWRQAHLRC